MNWRLQLAAVFTNRKRSVGWRLPAVATVVLLSAGLSAQAQQGGSLADAARQARAQKQAEPQSDSQAQQFADELAEDQNDSGAPGGFKTFNTGDYKIWVPAPYHLDGHDSAGVVLSGPMVGSKRPILLLGTPVVARFENSEAAFQDAATQFSHLYAQSASCAKATVANHSAYQCGLAVATLLGQRVSGNAVFVRSLGKIYPVFCVAPSDSGSRDFMNGTNNAVVKSWAVKGLQKDDDDFKGVLQRCETVFHSIRIPEGISAQKATAALNNSGIGGTTAGNPGQAPAPATGTAAGPASLADVARVVRQPGSVQPAQAPAASADPATQSSVPPGFKVQPFNYCKSHNECWDASVLIPTEAQLVSSDCKQFVFETKVQGAPFLLLAGPAGGDTCTNPNKSDASQIRWNELASPESQRAPGTYHLISSQQTTLDGKPAILTQIGFRKGMDEWMGKRAEIESNGVPLVVGCLAPREHFADGDTVCSGWIGSLRLP
jgi:hypothetical protein